MNRFCFQSNVNGWMDGRIDEYGWTDRSNGAKTTLNVINTYEKDADKLNVCMGVRCMYRYIILFWHCIQWNRTGKQKKKIRIRRICGKKNSLNRDSFHFISFVSILSVRLHLMWLWIWLHTQCWLLLLLLLFTWLFDR